MWKQTNNFSAAVLFPQHSFGTRTGRTSVVGEQINAGVCGPLTETTVGGARYYVCFKDDYSKYRHVSITTKGEVVDCLRRFLKEVRHVTKVLWSDVGKELNCEALQRVFEEYGIRHRLAMPYTPEQNSAAEQGNRTVVESPLYVLHACGLPKGLWVGASNTVVCILNGTGPAPVELWTGSYATLRHLHVFGTQYFVHIPRQKSHKWDPTSTSGRLVGYMGEKDGYRIWLPNELKIVVNRDVLCKPEVVCSARNDINQIESICPTLHVDPTEETEILQNYKSDDGSIASVAGGSNGSNLEIHVYDRKSIHEKKQPSWMTSGEFVCLVSDSQGGYCLSQTSYNEAMQSNEQNQWLKAMNEELASLKTNETLELVNRSVNAKVVQNRWVKMSSDDKARFKALLVAKDYSQKQGIDYDETFSPLTRYDTVRTLFAVATSQGMKLKQFDVKTALLYSELEEEVSLEQPEVFDDGSGRVCRLKRSLYGLKQAPRCWNKRFISFMEKAGWKNSTAYPCLFYRTHEDIFLYVAIYVDNGLVVANKEEERGVFLGLLQENLKSQLTRLRTSSECRLSVKVMGRSL
jgi:hypothetical protein